MPKIFLSYDRKDLSVARKLEQALKKNGHSVWRDQASVHGGEQWPKVTGEAIASCDYFMLVWSKSSAKSHFIEFEWTTAVALKKIIIPCLLDDLDVLRQPAALAATNAISLKNFERGFSEVLKTINKPVKNYPAHYTSEVAEKLSGITQTEPKEVLKAAKDRFAEAGWYIDGNVNNAGAIVRENLKTRQKSLLKKWQIWSALLATLLTAVSLLIVSPNKVRQLIESEPEFARSKLENPGSFGGKKGAKSDLTTYYDQMPSLGKLEIICDHDNVDYFLQGVYEKSLFPPIKDTLRVGSYRIALRTVKDGFGFYVDTTITINAGSTSILKPKFKKTELVMVTIRSNLSGAKIYVNGKLEDTTDKDGLKTLWLFPFKSEIILEKRTTSPENDYESIPWRPDLSTKTKWRHYFTLTKQ